MQEKNEIEEKILAEQVLKRLARLKQRTKTYQNLSFEILESKGKASELLAVAHSEMEEIAKATEDLLEYSISKVKDSLRED